MEPPPSRRESTRLPGTRSEGSLEQVKDFRRKVKESRRGYNELETSRKFARASRHANGSRKYAWAKAWVTVHASVAALNMVIMLDVFMGLWPSLCVRLVMIRGPTGGAASSAGGA
eukprot:3264040-Pleurochrysis_carterae.AAC.1